MSSRDLIHDAVVQALVRDGWTITADPYVIRYDDVTLFADLAAERTLSATRGERRIVVEIKSFLAPSSMADFELALGQFLLYRGYLEQSDPEAELFLAVTNLIYSDFFQREAIQLIVKRFDLALLSVDVEREEIVAWAT